MASQYSDAPESLSPSYPEIVPVLPGQTLSRQPSSQEPYGYNSGTGSLLPKPGQAWTSPQTAYNTTNSRDLEYDSQNGTYIGSASSFTPAKSSSGIPLAEKSNKKTVCGCSIVVFVLSVIIVILVGAVAGLATGTGIQTVQFNEANDKLQSLQESMTSRSFPTTMTTGNSPPTVTTAVIDNGCSSNPAAVNGKVYTAFELLGSADFTMRCGKDVAGPVLVSVFAMDFNACMDSCSAWTLYAPKMFGKNENSTCTGVSFIPLWTSKPDALKGKAPGNCYLKKNVDMSSFEVPNAGTPVHGAVLTSS